MSSVDNRVVNMQFNNARFESNAKKTMSTLDKLKEKLSFKDETKGLKEFQQTADDFSLDHMSRALDTISNKFTLMGRIGMEAMDRLATKVLNVGENLVRSISIDQISGGWTKYTEETNSVQAIIAAVKRRGQNKEDVYQALDFLTEYSDLSSYSFTQMTGALSMFVGAGQDLDRSAKAIKGIGNASAQAGVSIQDASYAFRNFSDAIGKGFFKREDWKSIQLIHMDTEELRESFIETAKALGVLDKQGRVLKDFTSGKKLKKPMEVTTANIAETLRYGWLNSEVIMKTLEQWADNQEATEAATLSRTFTDVMDTIKDVVSTGWKDTFKTIFGDIDEATSFFTNIANTVSEALGKVGEFRNAIFGRWRELGGRDSMIATLHNIWESMTAIKDISKDTLSSIFTIFSPFKAINGAGVDPNTVMPTHYLLEFTNGLRDATARFADWIKNSESLRSVLKGVASVVGLVWRVIKGVFTFAKDIWNQLKPTFKALWDFLAMIGEDLFKFDQKLRFSDGFINFFHNLAKIFEPLTSRLPKIVNWLRDLYNRIKTFLKTNPRMVAMREATERLFNAFIKFIPGAIDSLIQFGKQIFETIKNSKEWKWIKTNFEKYIKPVGQFLWDFAVEAKNVLADFFEMDTSGESTLWGKLKKRFSAFDKLGPWFQKKWAELKEKIPFLQNISDWWNTSPFIREMKQFFKTVGEAINSFFSLSFVGTDLEGGSIFAKLKARWDEAWKLLQPYFQAKWDQFSKWWQNIDWKQKLKDGIGKLWSALGSIFSPGEAEEGSIGAKLQKVLKPVGDWITNALNSVWEFLFGKKEQAEKKAVINTPNQKKAESGGKKEQKSIWKIVADWIADQFAVTKSNLDYMWTTVGKSITDSIEKVRKFLEDHGLSFDKIISGIREILKLRLMWKVGSMIGKVKKIFSSVSKTVMELGGVFKETRKTIKSIRKNGFGERSDFSEKLKNIGITLLLIAGSVWVIIKAIQEINTIPEEQFWEGAKRVGIILGAMTVMMAVINFTSKDDPGKIGGALKPLLTVIGIILMLKSVVKYIKILNEMSEKEFENGAGKLAIIMTAMTLIISILNKSSESDSGKLGSALKPLLTAIGIVVMLNAYVNAIERLTKISNKDIGVPTVILDSMLALFMAIMLVADSNKNEKGASKVLVTAIGVVLLMYSYSKAIERLANIGNDKMLMPALLIDSIIALTALLIKASKGITGVGLGGMAIALVGVIALVWSYAGALTMIKDLDPKLVSGFAIAVDALVLAVIAMSAAMAGFGKIDIGTVVKGAAVMLIAAAAIGGAIAIILGLVSGAVSDFSDTIAHVGANLAAYNDQVKDINFESLGGSIDFITRIAGTLVVVGTYNYGSLNSFISYVPRVGGAIKLYSDEVTKVTDWELMLDSARKISRIANLFNAMPDVTDKSVMLGQIGGAIGLYVQSLKSNLGENFSIDDIPSSEDIVAVFNALKGAFTGENAPSSEGMDDVASFASEDKANSLTLFSIGLENIATAIANFSSVASTLEFGDIDKATSALGAISTVAPVIDVEATGKFLGFEVTLKEHKEDLSTFATDIKLLGSALASFSTSCKDVDLELVGHSIDALKKITDINNALPTEGGLKGILLGNKMSLTSLGANLRNLGTGAKNFSESIAGGNFNETEGIMDNATNTLLKLANVNASLPETGGLRGWLMGDQDLSKFADTLGKLGGGAKAFAEAVTGTSAFNDISTIKAAANTLLVLAEVNTKLPKTGGISAWFEGDENINTFVDGLSKLGEGIRNFAISLGAAKTNIAGVDIERDALTITDDIVKAAEIINLMVPVLNVLSLFKGNKGDYFKYFEDVFGYLGAGIESLIYHFNKAFSPASGNQLDLTTLQYVNDTLVGLAGILPTLLGQKLDYDYTEAIFGYLGAGIESLVYHINQIGDDDISKAENTITRILDAVNNLTKLSEAEEITESLKQTGEMFVDALLSPFKADPTNPDNKKANSTIGELMVSMNTHARKHETNFQNTGVYLMRGLANGINKNRFAPINAVVGVINQAVMRANLALKIKSPSRVFEEIGMYSDQGLANGFLNYAGVVENAVADVSSTAFQTALSEIKALSDIPLDNLDSQPAIRPVIDTSNIAEGIGYIDDMLNSGHAVTLDTRSLDAKMQVLAEGDYGYDLAAITQRVQDMNDKLEHLSEVMGNLEVVMDSGALVGQLSEKIDKSMGARARRGERGN